MREIDDEEEVVHLVLQWEHNAVCPAGGSSAPSLSLPAAFSTSGQKLDPILGISCIIWTIKASGLD